ncbi:MAG: PEP-CTERM sorting domain-containing protein [Spirulinaceae cyanobacterium]
MNWQTLSLSLSALTIGAASLLSAPVQAATLSAGNCLGDEANCSYNDPFFSLSASDGAGSAQLTRKTFADSTGIGVATSGTTSIYDDPSWGEIDFDETLDVTFAFAKVLDKLDLGFLYQPGVNHDRVFETAKITATLSDGSFVTETFSITGDNTGSVTGGGTVTNLSPSTPGDAGLYSLQGIFGREAILGFSVTAVEKGENLSTQSWDSDFVVASAEAVPEPSIILGLLGVGALGAVSRRKK